MNARKGNYAALMFTVLNYLVALFFFLGVTSTAIAEGLNKSGESDTTQAPTWQISRGLDYANHQYTDVPVYNANGSKAIMTDNKDNFYISTNLEAKPYKLTFKEKPKAKVEWDSKDPDIIYYISAKKKVTSLHSFNIKAGTDNVIFTTNKFVSEVAPGHPDGDHLLLYAKDKPNSTLFVFSISTKKCIEIPVTNTPLHRVRFTTAPDLSVYINSPVNPKPSYTINVKTGEKKLIYKGQQTSPNWRPGGQEYCFYGSHNGERMLMVLDKNGNFVKGFKGPTNHLVHWSPDGKYIITDPDMHRTGMYQGWICMIDYNTGKVRQVVRHNSEFIYNGKKLSSGQPEPRLSPDGTKLIYNSNRFGIDHPQVFVSLVHLPDPVTNVKMNKADGMVNITWNNPPGVEIHNILVYRIKERGTSELAGEVTIPNASFIEKYVPGTIGYKIVTEEYSGLKSKAVELKMD